MCSEEGTIFIRQIGEVLVDISEKILKEEIPEEERKKLKKRIGDIKNDPPLQIYIGGIDGAYGASVIARPDFLKRQHRLWEGISILSHLLYMR